MNTIDHAPLVSRVVSHICTLKRFEVPLTDEVTTKVLEVDGLELSYSRAVARGQPTIHSYRLWAEDWSLDLTLNHAEGTKPRSWEWAVTGDLARCQADLAHADQALAVSKAA